MTAEELRNEALELSLEERTWLTSQLLQSIEEPSSTEVERRWTEVALRRYQDLKNDPSKGVSLDDVRADLRSRLD